MDTERLCLGCMTDKGDEHICPHCGFDPSQEAASPIYLPPGTVLNNKYLLGRVLGHGGFGITYLAWDMSLELKVAVKEYLPDGLATRSSDHVTVTRYTGDKARHFEYGLNKFLDEARTLARFHDHPGIVSVMYVFEENDTAYFVMSYLEGSTLKGYLKKQGGRIRYSLARDIIMPVLDALRVVHERGLLHRDISPDNIFITRQGQVKLLDFGAARYSMGEQSRSLSVILKPGYAPEEQYRSKGRQGPWTDVYATAATMYRAITGLRPEEALDRLEQDELKLPSELGAAIPPEHESAIMKALAVKADDRYQSVDEFQAVLLSGEAAQAVPVGDMPTAAPAAAVMPDGFNQATSDQQATQEHGGQASTAREPATRELAEEDHLSHEPSSVPPPAPMAASSGAAPGGGPVPPQGAGMPTPPTQGVIPPVGAVPPEDRYSAMGLPPEQQSKGFPWGKTLAALVILAILGAGAWVYFVHPDWIIPPDGPGTKPVNPGDPIPMSQLYTLTVNTSPSGAQVSLPGTGITYFQGMALEPGTYDVRVSMPGYTTKKESVVVKDRNVEVSIELQPETTAVTGDNDLWIDPVTGMEFVFVSGGCYEMGCGSWASGCDDDEYPVHMVCVDDFWMGRYEVTQAEYEQLMGSNPSSSTRSPNNPVDSVTYYEAAQFADALNGANNYQYTFRLPTEAEWEYACRDGGQHQTFSGGYSHYDVSQSRDQNIDSSRPVGLLLPNELGIYDMSGNVWEWVLDTEISDAYATHNRMNPVVTASGEYNIVRSGSWADAASETRCGERGSWSPSSGDSDLGFRMIRLP